MRKDDAYLEDILEAAKSIQRFTRGVSVEALKANEEKIRAMNRKFENIGEAACRLSPETRNLFPEIPWRLLTAMRNILIHNYDDVDLNVVWSTIRRDLPPLIVHLKTYQAANPPP